MSDILEMIDAMGIYEILNPFLLIFLIVYATVSYTKVLSKKKNINVAFSVIIALITIFPHVIGIGPDFVPLINLILPSFALIAVIFFCAIFLAAVFGVKVNKYIVGSLMAILVAFDLVVPDVLLIAIFARGAGIELPNWLSWVQSPEFWPTLIAGAALFLAIAYVYRN